MIYPKRNWFPHSPAPIQWLCWLIARTLALIFNIRRKGLENLPQGGFLAIAPHINFLDPVFILGTFPRPVHFIGDAHFLFLNPFNAWIMWAAGVVPVNRKGSDPYAVRQYLRLMAKGDICVLFPEGGRSLNAQPIQPMIQATKLVSKLKIPVVTVALEGAYDSWPRWDARFRMPRGRIQVRFVEFLSKDQEQKPPAKPSLSSVFDHKKIINILAERKKIFNSLKRAAEGEAAAVKLDRPGRPKEIPRLLLFCPQCAAPTSLSWQENRRNFQCAKCRFTMHLKENKLGAMSHGQFGPYLTIDHWFNKSITALTQKNPGELSLSIKINANISQSGHSDTQPQPASVRLDKNGLALRTDEAMFTIPLAIASKGLLEGSGLLVIPCGDKIVSLYSEEGLAPAWIILARYLAGWDDLFSES